jgi:hypothetical protein
MFWFCTINDAFFRTEKASGMATKPTLYLDTNIVSMLHYRGAHAMARVQHQLTVDWWKYERGHFQLVASQWTEDELSDGYYSGQSAALAAVRRLRYLPRTADVLRCATCLTDAGVVPKTKLGDAIQLAFATIHRIDYLLTWNFAHLANVQVQHNMDALNRRQGWWSPLLVSPQTIPWASLGQEIGRKHER